MLGRHVTHRRPQLAHPVARKPVEDPGPVPAGGDQARTGHRPQMMRGVRHALADLAGDLLHRPLALGQQVGDLSPPAARQRPGNLREPLIQGILRRAVSHASMI